VDRERLHSLHQRLTGILREPEQASIELQAGLPSPER
jgi:hypothetical protein